MNLLRRLMALSLFAPTVVAAATTYSYSFSFSVKEDNQHHVILDYQLRAGFKMLTAVDRRAVEAGMAFYRDNERIVGPPCTNLFLKWRDISGGNPHEESIIWWAGCPQTWRTRRSLFSL